MEFDELLCIACFSQFDKDEHLPLMVPRCGHTFCTKCLQDMLSKVSSKEDFICPEDQTAMKLSTKDISEFPQNFALLRLIDKRSTYANSEKQSDSLSREGRSFKKELKSSSDKSPSSTQEFSSPMISPNRLTKSGSSIRSSFNQQDMFYLMHADNNMCREHMRKLEIVCLEHKCRICANCALFGAHKNHDIKPEEEVLREIAARAERLIDIFQAMEKTQSSAVDQEMAEKATEKIKKKCDETVKNIRQKFNDYVNAIRAKERKLLSEVGDKFTKMEEKFRSIRQLPQDLQEKLNRWKTRTHESLLSVTEKSERGEIAFDLLEDRITPKNDLLMFGEKLILDLEKANEVNSKLLDNHLQRISATFDGDFTKNIETLCSFEMPEPSLSSNNDGFINGVIEGKSNSKAGMPLGEIANRSSSKQSKQEGDFQDFAVINGRAGFLDSLRHEDRLKSRSPTKRGAKSFAENRPPERLNLLDDDFYTNYCKLESIGDKLGNIEKNYEDEHNLLNFEWKDLNSVIPMTDASVYYSRDSASGTNQQPQHQHQHQRKQSEDFNYSHNVSRDGKEENANTSRRLSASKDDSIMHSRNEKQGLSGKKSTMRATSPWRKNSSEVGIRLPRTKKRTVLKVAVKFEPVIEGIELNNIDTADLTAADLGDQGVLALVEHLKENTTLKSLKLLKNKITDEGGVALANLLYHNKTLHTINLTQNLLTEKTLDAFIDAIKAQKSIRLKSLYFSQNTMSLRFVKPKLKELAELGVNAIL